MATGDYLEMALSIVLAKKIPFVGVNVLRASVRPLLSEKYQEK
jgi:hypothetical protein